MMEPILAVKDLVKRFGGLTAIDNVSLDVYPGEIVALVGDNGAGKSTLIKMVSGVYHPSAGSIYYQGQRMHVSQPSEARQMGIETIYQDLALAGNLNVAANIFLGREMKKRLLGMVPVLDEKKMSTASKEVLDMLDVHIPSFNTKIDKLSGGQRQAVAIARALFWQAKLLIMDEPTNNLGVVEQGKVLDLIKNLHARQDLAIILISHTMHDVFAVSDRIAILRRGQKVGEKRTAETSREEIVQYIMGLKNDYAMTL
jgi:ABC-type sugar transport system ATPase subunit